MLSILKKTPESVNAEDLETLQNELEEKLVSVVTRKWELERENNSNNANITSTGGILPKRPHQSKHRSKIVPSKFRNIADEHRKNKKQIHRNEAPDKLWPFVEQFCATPTKEQIGDLEDMIKSIDDDKDYYKIPPLGMNKKDSVSCKDSPSKVVDNNNPAKRRAKSRSVVDEEHSSAMGALTQRLVSSLIEEADGGLSNDAPSDSGNDGNSSNSQQSSKKKGSKSRSNKNIDSNSAKNLEKIVKQELVEHEILDQHDDIPYTSEDDEILRELYATRYELSAIQSQNKDSMQRLLKKAKKHAELEAQREKLREANEDVVAAYHPLIQAKQRKRNPSKQEKEAAIKALKVQETIFKKCDELYLSTIIRD